MLEIKILLTGKSNLGPFNNYVNRILTFFDHPLLVNNFTK